MTVENKRMRQLRGTAASWTSANPTLLEGEIGIETDTRRWKVGPGAWNSLAYFGEPAPLSNYTANRAPDDNDDASQGYTIGSEWFDASAGFLYKCVDATTASAKWFEIGEANPATLGSAAALDEGTDVGELPALVDVNGTPGFPAGIDGSGLINVSAVVPLAVRTVTSGESFVAFTNAAWFDGTFPRLRFDFYDMRPTAAGTNFWLQVSNDGGASWIAGTDYRVCDNGTNGLGTPYGNTYTHDRFGISGDHQNGPGAGAYGFVDVFNPDVKVNLIANAVFRATGAVGGDMFGNDVWGTMISTTAIDAVRFLFSSGTMLGGTIIATGYLSA